MKTKKKANQKTKTKVEAKAVTPKANTKSGVAVWKRMLLFPILIFGTAAIVAAVTLPMILNNKNKNNEDKIPDFKVTIDNPDDLKYKDSASVGHLVTCLTSLPKESLGRYNLKWTIDATDQVGVDSTKHFSITENGEIEIIQPATLVKDDTTDIVIPEGTYTINVSCTVAAAHVDPKSVNCSPITLEIKNCLWDGSNWDGHNEGTLTCEQNGEEQKVTLKEATSYKATNLVIPDRVWSDDTYYDITIIGDETVWTSIFNKNNVTGTLTLPNNLVTIHQSSFYECTNLSGLLVIPSSVQTIGRNAFYNCFNFTGLTLKNGISEIGASAFKQCKGFTGSLNLPDSLNKVGDSAFYQCENFNKLLFGSGLKEIGQLAFSQCKNFTGELNIPVGLTNVGQSAFAECAKLTSLSIPSDASTWLNPSSLPPTVIFQMCYLVSQIKFYPSTQFTLPGGTFYLTGRDVNVAIAKTISVPENSNWQRTDLVKSELLSDDWIFEKSL